MEDSKLLLTVDEAAHRLGIGRSHAYIYVMRGELEVKNLGTDPWYSVFVHSFFPEAAS